MGDLWGRRHTPSSVVTDDAGPLVETDALSVWGGQDTKRGVFRRKKRDPDESEDSFLQERERAAEPESSHHFARWGVALLRIPTTGAR